MTTTTSSWHSYPKIWNLGHREVLTLLDGPELIVEEKVDGSQFSFGRFDDGLRARSKGQEIILDAPEKLFARAVQSATGIKDQLTLGWTYRCEYLQKPKHNALAYDRVPKDHLVLLDVETSDSQFLSRWEKEKEATRLGMEVVPVLAHYNRAWSNVEWPTFDTFKQWMDTISFLGGQKVEGVVIKNYAKVDSMGHTMMGKYVSEAFKEVHKGDWRDKSTGSLLDRIIAKYRTPARWAKGVQHLREQGRLLEAPQDIGNLIKEVRADLLNEACEDIRDWLWQEFADDITRGITAGLPEWYKQELAKKQFEGGEGGQGTTEQNNS